MFAVLVAGRLVQTNSQQVDETKVLYDLEDISGANHIVVFMTGQTPFPDGYGGAVFLNVPSPENGESTWLLLGHITNQKPSAIFKISGLKHDSRSPQNAFMPSNTAFTPSQPHHAQLGIAVEQLAELAQQTPITGVAAPKASTFVEFTEKMLLTFYNYAASFSVSKQAISSSFGSSSEEYVPMSILNKWFQEFKTKLQRDPNFWKS